MLLRLNRSPSICLPGAPLRTESALDSGRRAVVAALIFGRVSPSGRLFSGLAGCVGAVISFVPGVVLEVDSRPVGKTELETPNGVAEAAHTLPVTELLPVMPSPRFMLALKPPQACSLLFLNETQPFSLFPFRVSQASSPSSLKVSHLSSPCTFKNSYAFSPLLPLLMLEGFSLRLPSLLCALPV